MRKRSYMRRASPTYLHPHLAAPLARLVLSSAAADEIAARFSLLADPTRVRILHALSLTEELCVFDLAILLGLSQSAVSHQLGLLRGQRVVARRKDGRIVFYRLADDRARRLLDDAVPETAGANPRRTNR
jgi:ArsR family transcriptional regulator